MKKNYADIFEAALTQPNKKYITFRHDHYSTTSHSKRKADLQALFTHIQQYLAESAFSEDFDRQSLTDLIENTRRLKERYEERAGNILVRLKLYTPKKKRDTLASADALIEKAQALYVLKGCIDYPSVEREELNEKLAALTGDDPTYVLKLLEEAAPEKPLHHIQTVLIEMVQQQFGSLMQAAFTHFDLFEKGLYTFRNGVWSVKAHPHSTPLTNWENLQKLAVNALNYLPYIDYDSALFQENRDKLNMIMKRGLGISCADGRYWRDQNAKEMLKFEDRIQYTPGPTLKEAMIPRIIKENGAVTPPFQKLLDEVMPLEEILIDNPRTLTAKQGELIDQLIEKYIEGSDNFRNAFKNMSHRLEFYMNICNRADPETIRAVPAILRLFYLNNLLWKKKDNEGLLKKDNEGLLKLAYHIERMKISDVSKLSPKKQKDLVRLFYLFHSSADIFKLYAPFTFRFFQQLENDNISADAPFIVKVAQMVKGKAGYFKLIKPLFELYSTDREAPISWEKKTNYLILPLDLKQFCDELLPWVSETKTANAPEDSGHHLMRFIFKWENIYDDIFEYKPVNEEDWIALEGEAAYERFSEHLQRLTAELENCSMTLDALEMAYGKEHPDILNYIPSNREFISEVKLELRDMARSKTIEEFQGATT